MRIFSRTADVAPSPAARQAGDKVPASVASSPYTRDLSAPPGDRIPLIRERPDEPDFGGDDAACFAWTDARIVADECLGLWAGDYRTTVAECHEHDGSFAWLFEGMDVAGRSSVPAAARLLLDDDDGRGGWRVQVLVGCVRIGFLKDEDARSFGPMIVTRGAHDLLAFVRVDLHRDGAEFPALPQPD